MTNVKLELSPTAYANLRVLVLAGAKSGQTDERAIHVGSQLLLLMDQQVAAQEAQQQIRPVPADHANGHTQTIEARANA